MKFSKEPSVGFSGRGEFLFREQKDMVLKAFQELEEGN